MLFKHVKISINNKTDKMETQYKVGVIGCGYIGEKYIRYLNQCSSAKLLVVCDSNENLAQELAKRYNISNYECDWRNVVTDKQIDLICVCVPNNLHFNIAREAIKNYKHVICEKPLAGNIAQSIELAQLAKLNNIYSHCAYNLIQAPAIQFAKSIIDNGVLGDFVTFRGSYDNGRLANPQIPFEWRMQKEYTTGGVINDLSINIIAISQFLVGDIKSVCGMSNIIYHQRHDKKGAIRMVENEDIIQFITQYPNGAMGYIASSRVSPGSLQNMQFEIHFTRGIIKYSLERMNEISIYKNGDAGFTKIISQNGNWFNVGYDELKSIDIHKFIEGILNGKESLSDFTFAAKIDLVVSAVLESARSMKWIEISDQHKL